MNTLTAWLIQQFPEVTPAEFYRTMFPFGSLDVDGAMTKGKYTGIINRIIKSETGKPKVYRYTLTDDLNAVEEVVQSDDFCICRPLSYAGKSATKENARMMYAIAIDVDRVKLGGPTGVTGLSSLWNLYIVKNKELPRPTFIVSSGSGLHLYYILEKPLPMYRDIVAEMQELKHELTLQVWNDNVVDIHSVFEVQQEGVYQGFRMPGTVTKDGKSRVRAFLTGERVTVDYLNGFVPERIRAKKAAKHSQRVDLATAAERWPDWYQARIVEGKPAGQNQWAVNRRVYEWWLKRIRKEATVGHRYYCCMMLAVYAMKCSKYDEKKNPEPVTRDELERDCFGLLEVMESRTDKETNHFTAADIQDALEAFDEDMVRYPRKAIEYRTGIRIDSSRRNGRKQADHLIRARFSRDMNDKERGGKWDTNNGHQSQVGAVLTWKREHPGGNVAQCVQDTGLSRATVYRHWKLELDDDTGK